MRGIPLEPGGALARPRSAVMCRSTAPRWRQRAASTLSDDRLTARTEDDQAFCLAVFLAQAYPRSTVVGSDD
jgi:hypothetical protein